MSIQDAARALLPRIDEGMRIAMLGEPFDFAKLVSVDEQRPDCKPKGFWYGVGASWIEWVLSDMPSGTRPFIYLLDVDVARLVKVSTPEALDEFTNAHAEEDESRRPFAYYYIRWNEFVPGMAGIEIAPYLWERRLDPKAFWYYGWDCASGCVWDRTAIRSVMPFATYDAARDEYVVHQFDILPKATEKIIEVRKRKINWK